MWQPLRESSGRSLSQILQQFYYAGEKEKHGVCTIARLGLAAGEAGIVMPTGSFVSRSTLPSIYISSRSPSQIPAFSHLPPPEIKQKAFILPGIF